MNNQQTLFCGIYDSPSGSPYANDDIFELLKHELLLYIHKFRVNNVVLGGDLNSRVGIELDYSPVETNRFLDEGFEDNPPPLRSSQDLTTNRRGVELLNFCKSTGFLILNGRTGMDNGVGKTTSHTYNGESVVDYVIMNRSCYENVLEFEIIDRPESKHSCLVFSIGKPQEVIQPSDDTSILHGYRKVNWNDETALAISNKLATDEIRDRVQLVLEHCTDGNALGALDMLYDIAWQCCDGFIRLPRKNTGTHHISNDEPWFDDDCRNAKSDVISKQKQFRANRCKDNLSLLSTVKTNFTDVKKAKKREYRSQSRLELVQAASDKNKKFWKILKPPKAVPESTISAQQWFDHFSSLYSSRCISNNSEPNADGRPILVIPVLDNDFTMDELVKALRQSKPNKACGIDGIPSDVWKAAPGLNEVILNIFNLFFENCTYPDVWRTAALVAIFKKLDPSDPNCYRGISLLSSLSKDFSICITNRLKNWVESNGILLDTQCGYRAGFSTIDNIFIFASAVSRYMNLNRSVLFCAFIDFRKAYDLVDRRKLWFKLQQIGVSTKMINMLREIYSSVKACVKVGSQHVTDTFESHEGLRQGENSSCLLFSLYINDLADYLISNGASPLIVGQLYLTALLFADDLSMFGETEKGLQKKLNLLYEYCELWNLKINESKSKVMILGNVNRQNQYNYQWHINGQPLEVVNEYVYVGLLISSNNSWNPAKAEIVQKATRACFALVSNLKRFGNLPIPMMLNLFDIKILPILLYGSEIWGAYGFEEMQLMVDNFYRSLLCLKKNSSVTFVRGELGQNSLAPVILMRVIKYWIKLLSSDADTAIRKCYNVQYVLAERGNDCWAWRVKQILFQYGFGNAWIGQSTLNVKLFISEFKVRIYESDSHAWHLNLVSFTSFRFYKTLKNELILEPYLTLELPLTIINIIARFRGAMLKIRVNEGRWSGIDYDARKCPMCNSDVVENELHVVFDCRSWSGFRGRLSYFDEYKERDVKAMFRNATKAKMLALGNYLKLVMQERQDILSIL